MSADRERPESWEVLARRASTRDGVSGDAVEARQLLALRLDASAYALPVERVREIVRLRPITPVPRVPTDVRGVISLRGEIVQVIDLRSRLGLPAADPGRTSRIVVVHADAVRAAGLLVDAVAEVFSVFAEALRPAEGEAGKVESLCARGDEFVSILALDRVLDIDAGD